VGVGIVRLGRHATDPCRKFSRACKWSLLELLAVFHLDTRRKDAMHRALTGRWLGRALRISEASPATAVPLFLCPAVSRPGNIVHRRIPPVPIRQVRANHTDAVIPEAAPSAAAPTETPAPVVQDAAAPARRIPLTCSGCGAFTQTSDADQLGYYDLNARRVKAWLHPKKPTAKEPSAQEAEEDRIVRESLKLLDPSQLEALGMNPDALVPGDAAPTAPGMCNSRART
jgi:hypothetical protein